MSSPQLDSWLTCLSRFWFSRVPARSPRLRGRRLLLESLEDRFVPSVNTLLSSGIRVPTGIALDSSGNLYIADNGNHAIDEFVRSSNTLKTLVSTGLFNPYGVAVDSSGNVYIADASANAIKEWVASSQKVITLVSSGLVFPTGVAVDGSSNVYIADNSGNAIKEWVASSQTLTTLVSSGLRFPYGVAVDGSGNVYIADSGSDSIKEWLASSQTLTTLESGLASPAGIAVDGAGNVYFSATGSGAIEVLTASSQTPVKLVSSGLSIPYGVAVDGGGNVYIADTGNNAVKELSGLPSITTQPQDVTATAGESAAESFIVANSGGAGPLSVHWQISTDNGSTFINLRDGGGFTGSTTKTLSISRFTGAGSSKYRAVLTDANGLTATSHVATLTVNAAPSISTQPQNVTAAVGQSTAESFAIADTGGTGPLSVQWQVSTDKGSTFTNLSDGNDIAGSATTNLTLSSFTTAGSSEYRAVVTDVNGVTAASNPATLTITTSPNITNQPANQIATAGQIASESFSVTANGKTPITYQWQLSTDDGKTFNDVSNGSGVSGAATATLTISSNALPASGTEYRAVVTDAGGTALNTTPATLIINTPPSITTQPQNTTALIDQSAAESFTIAASGGTGPLSVQWEVSTDNGGTFTNLSDGRGITGSTTTTLTLRSFTMAGSPEYRAVVTDANGVSATSNPASLTTTAGPSITTQPANQLATVGQTASESFSVVATGTAPFTYQWELSTDGGNTFNDVSNGSGVSGANTAMLTISSNALPASGTEYRAVVDVAGGTTLTSKAAILTVNAPPSITIQPQNLTGTVGQPAAEFFTIADIGGTGPLSVQWQVSTDNGSTFNNLSDGNGITGSKTTALTRGGSATAGSSEYRAIITDANGVSATSSPATLSVNAAPTITKQPQNGTATVGQSAAESFTVADSGGTGPLSVQWQISMDNGATFTNLSDGNGVAGSTTATLSLSNFTAAGSPEYRAFVTDANETITTSDAATLNVNAAPSITTQPQNVAATVGQSAAESFTVADNGGTGPLSVQWQVSRDHGGTFTNLSDGNGVAGSANTTLIVGSFTAAGSSDYRAIITDANGVTTGSNAATLTVNAMPSSGNPSPPPRPGNPNESWLSQAYADLLHRPLDPSGLATWSSLLNQGMSRTQVVQLIQSSLEYRTDVVEELYSSLLHRPADAFGLNTFTSFLGKGGTVQQVEAAILGSAEYFQLHGGSNSGFLSAVYRDVFNRSLDAGGANTWELAFASGQSRDTVVGAILASQESDGDEVQSFFTTFLHRSADPSGLNSFTTALQHGVSQEAAIAGIVGSDEYFARAQ
jgi:sugar lactone lactonase YvrE